MPTEKKDRETRSRGLAPPRRALHIRRRVPKDLVDRFGRAELKASLRTRDPRLGRLRHAAALSGLLVVFERVRADPMLTQAQCLTLAHGALAVALELQCAEQFGGTPSTLWPERTWPERDRALREAAGRGDASRALPLADAAARRAGIGLDGDDRRDPLLLQLAMRALIEATHQGALRQAGRFALDPQDPLFRGFDEAAFLASGGDGTPAAAPAGPAVPIADPGSSRCPADPEVPAPAPAPAPEPASVAAVAAPAPAPAPASVAAAGAGTPATAHPVIPESVCRPDLGEVVPAFGPNLAGALVVGIGPRSDLKTAKARASRIADLTPVQFVNLVLLSKTTISAGTRRQYERAAREFEELVGTRPMWRYTESDAWLTMTLLCMVPAARGQGEEARGKRLDMIEANLARDEHERDEVRTAKTVRDGYLVYLRNIFAAAVKQNAIDANPFLGVKPDASSGARASTKKDALQGRHLEAIARVPLFSGCHSDARLNTPGSHHTLSWQRWPLLISCMQGLRPHEIGQLQPSDLVYRDGIPCLAVSGTLSDAHHGGGAEVLHRRAARRAAKRIKTSNSRREIPIHPFLVRIGLVKLMEEARSRGQDRVFPDWPLCSKGTYSEAANDFYDRNEEGQQGVLVQAGVKTETISLYSGRHTFANLMRNAGIAEGIQSVFMGHAGKSVTDQYGDRFVNDVNFQKYMNSYIQDFDASSFVRSFDCAGLGDTEGYAKLLRILGVSSLPWERRPVRMFAGAADQAEVIPMTDAARRSAA